MKTFEIAPLLLEAHLPEKPDSNHPSIENEDEIKSEHACGSSSSGGTIDPALHCSFLAS